MRREAEIDAAAGGLGTQHSCLKQMPTAHHRSPHSHKAPKAEKLGLKWTMAPTPNDA